MYLFTDAYCLEVSVVLPERGEREQRVIFPAIVKEAQVSRQGYGWCVIACQDAFSGILSVTLHCQEVHGDGCEPRVLDPQTTLFRSHGGYQGEVFGDGFVRCQGCQEVGGHVAEV